jgi:hypothetical protein
MDCCEARNALVAEFVDQPREFDNQNATVCKDEEGACAICGMHLGLWKWDVVYDSAYLTIDCDWTKPNQSVKLCCECDLKLTERALRFLGFADWQEKYIARVVHHYWDEVELFGDIRLANPLAKICLDLHEQGLWPLDELAIEVKQG